MPDDLNRLFGELASQVPTAPREEFDFTEGMLPVPAECLASDALFIQKLRYRYGGYHQVDSLWFHARYETYRHLALLILARMFHPQDTPLRIDLSHPTSDIKHIMLDYNYNEYGWRNFYYARPYRVHYDVIPLEGYHGPGAVHPLHMDDRLQFRVSNLQDDVGTEEEYESRDTVWLSGNDRAYVTLAEYLLNIGRPDETEGMYRLEGTGDHGIYLSFWSAEARFILPDHTYWREEEWPSKEGLEQAESDPYS